MTIRINWQYELFELFEIKYENICVYETKNKFASTEGELKARYNYHKKSFIPCTNENATELSDTFGT